MKKCKFALIGKSLSHSKSPQIHLKYATSNKILITYETIEICNLDDNVIKYLKTLNGFNVTFPYKEEILKYLDDCSLDVLKTKSCNCVKVISGKLIGYNTDYFGFKFYFTNILENYKFSNILVFGYGGGAKAVISVLKDLNLNFYVSNRTLDKIDSVSKISLEEANNNIQKFDLIINATSCGYNNDTVLKNQKLNNNQVLIDLNYNLKITPFLKIGYKCDCKIINGLDMLVVQALKSQNI